MVDPTRQASRPQLSLVLGAPMPHAEILSGWGLIVSAIAVGQVQPILTFDNHGYRRNGGGGTLLALASG
jgi:hypothetical protein